MKSLKQLYVPCSSAFDAQRRGAVLDIGDLVDVRIELEAELSDG